MPFVPLLSTHLPLHEWASLRTELIWIYDRKVAAPYLQGKHAAQPGFRAWLIRRGKVTVSTNSRTYSAGPGMWLMPPSGSSEANFSPHAHILSISFLCQWPSGENILTGKEGLSFKTEKYPSLERHAKKLEVILRQHFSGSTSHVYTHQSSEYGTFLQVQGLFFQWLATWFHVEIEAGARLTRLTSGDSRPFQAARCLNEAPLDQGFPVGRLQRQAGLGLMRLNQLFFSEFGLTTRKYWDRRRLEFAKQCLETSRMPMKEIAFLLGFRSDSHFVVWFRRLSGARPSDYRRGYLSLA